MTSKQQSVRVNSLHSLKPKKSGVIKCCRMEKERERKQAFFIFASSSSESLIAQFYKLNFLFC